LPQEIIDIKWPSKHAPKYVVGNLRATTTIAYDLKLHDLTGIPLNSLKTSFEGVFNRIIPGIQWIKNEIIEKSGQQWIYLELTSNAIDADVHNIILITIFKKQMLVFNFNSTREDFPKYEKELRESIKSIRLPNDN